MYLDDETIAPCGDCGHGEWRHQIANADLAVATGIPRERVLVTVDGGVIDLVKGRASVVGEVPCGFIYVDGSSVGETTETLLKDRRILRDEGFITCIVVIDASTGKIAAGPEITARGFAEDQAVFEQGLDALNQGLQDDAAPEAVGRALRRIQGAHGGCLYR